MVRTLVRYCAPVVALGVVAGCTIVTTSDHNDAGGGSGGEGAAGTGGSGVSDAGKVPTTDAGDQDGKGGADTGGKDSDAGPPTLLPASCYNVGTPACNPLTNGGCASNAACDYGLDTQGNMALGCYGGDNPGANTGANGAACNNQTGPWCMATHHCSGVPETCGKFCCANSDCPGGGSCVAFDSTNVGTLGTCAGGSSPGGVVTLATAQNKPNAIAVDGANVYWANVGGGYGSTDGAIMKVGVAGGNPVTLASGQADPSGLATDGQNVYWTNQSANTIMQVAVGGGEPSALASEQAGPAGIAVHEGVVYWCSQYSGIRKVSVKGGAWSLVASSNCGYHIAVAGGYVYWANNSGSTGNIMRVSVDADPQADASSPPAVMAAGQFSPWSVAADLTAVYWTHLQPDTGSVLSANLTGGSVNTLAAAQAYPWDVVVDGSGIYWSNGGNGTGANTIMKMSLVGGSITTLASDQSNPNYLAMDGTSVYWTNTGDGTVRKVGK